MAKSDHDSTAMSRRGDGGGATVVPVQIRQAIIDEALPALG